MMNVLIACKKFLTEFKANCIIRNSVLVVQHFVPTFANFANTIGLRNKVLEISFCFVFAFCFRSPVTISSSQLDSHLVS